jgi:DNA-binding GntR family transcriptional regulator
MNPAQARPRTNYGFARQTLRADILEGRLEPGAILLSA